MIIVQLPIYVFKHILLSFMSANEQDINQLQNSLQELSVIYNSDSEQSRGSNSPDLEIPYPNLTYQLADSDSDSEFRGWPTNNNNMNVAQQQVGNQALAPPVAPNTEQLISAASNYGKILPKYDGRSDTLESFIAKVDSFFDHYGNTRDQTLNRYVFCLICSKLTDEADGLVSCRSDIEDWPTLKETLRTKFGDHTDRKILTHQFKNLKIKIGEGLNDFIHRIKVMQNTLDIKINMDDTITREQKEIYRQIHEQTAIELLYNNSSPMLQTILDVRDHNDFAQAVTTALNYISKHPTDKTQKPSNQNPNTGHDRDMPRRYYNNFQPPRWTNFQPRYASNQNRPSFNPQYNNSQRPYQTYQQTPRNFAQFRPQNNYMQQRPQNYNYNSRPARPAPDKPTSNVQNYQGTAFRRWRQPQTYANNTEIYNQVNPEPIEQNETYYSRFPPTNDNYRNSRTLYHDSNEEELNENIQNFRLGASEN